MKNQVITIIAAAALVLSPESGAAQDQNCTLHGYNKKMHQELETILENGSARKLNVMNDEGVVSILVEPHPPRMSLVSSNEYGMRGIYADQKHVSQLGNFVEGAKFVAANFSRYGNSAIQDIWFERLYDPNGTKVDPRLEKSIGEGSYRKFKTLDLVEVNISYHETPSGDDLRGIRELVTKGTPAQWGNIDKKKIVAGFPPDIAKIREYASQRPNVKLIYDPKCGVENLK